MKNNFVNQKLRELLFYLIFGVLTTLVNLIVFKLSNLLLGEDCYLISNLLAWIFAVSFAYVTNKLWVFSSKSWAWSILKRELPSFIGARVFSLLIEEAGLYLTLTLLSMKSLSLQVLGHAFSGTDIWKLIMQFIVIVLNYIFSKFIIFKRNRAE